MLSSNIVSLPSLPRAGLVTDSHAALGGTSNGKWQISLTLVNHGAGVCARLVAAARTGPKVSVLHLTHRTSRNAAIVLGSVRRYLLLPPRF